jgi:hypothetical protein
MEILDLLSAKFFPFFFQSCDTTAIFIGGYTVLLVLGICCITCTRFYLLCLYTKKRILVCISKLVISHDLLQLPSLAVQHDTVPGYNYPPRHPTSLSPCLRILKAKRPCNPQDATAKSLRAPGPSPRPIARPRSKPATTTFCAPSSPAPTGRYKPPCGSSHGAPTC